MFVEHGHDRNHMLASINEKGNRKNYVNDNSNTKNLVKLPWKPVNDQNEQKS